MPRICFILFIIFVFYIFHECQTVSKGIEMVPERVQLVYVNPKYIAKNLSVGVRRSSRGGQYVVNLSGHNYQLWGNNVSLFLYFQQFLSNEYRRSFVNTNYRFCDYINEDPYGKFLQRFGVVCPLESKNWILSNVTIKYPSFPYKFPFEKFRAEVVLRRTQTEELIFQGFLYLKIKNI